MIFQPLAARSCAYAIAVCVLMSSISVGQTSSETAAAKDATLTTSLITVRVDPASASKAIVSPTVALYFDPVQGSSSVDLVRRALASNGELAAARLDVERARARLRQAGLRPNPSVDFEQTTGRFTGAAGERETSIGVSIPLELGGRRGRRIDLAKAEGEGGGGES